MMMPGSSFGGRVLPPYELYRNLTQIYKGKEYITRPVPSMFCSDETPDDKYNMMSFLNVIADSGVVETYLITKTELAYLHD
jgi:hypothetical protein